MKVKIQVQSNVGTSMFSKTAPNGAAEPWQQVPPTTTKSSISNHLLHRLFLFWGATFYIYFATTRSFLHLIPPTNGKVLAVGRLGILLNLRFSNDIIPRLSGFTIMSKRSSPASPDGKTTPEDATLKSPPRSKQFTGGQAMDQDQAAWPSVAEQKQMEDAARAQRLAEREAKKKALAERIAEQKRTGRKVRKNQPVVDADGFTKSQ